MNTIAAWVLVTLTHSYAGMQYSPQVADLASCQRLQAVAKFEATRATQCVQIIVYQQGAPK